MRNLIARSLVPITLIGGLLVPTPNAPTAAATGPTLYMVTNVSGDPAVSGSLPWALMQANYVTPGFDYIRFDLPVWPIQEIVITQPLWVNDSVDISVPLDSAGPTVGIRGTNLPYLFILQSDPTLGVTSSSTTIAGLGMTGFTDAALVTTPAAQGLFIQDNWIGFARPPGFGGANITNVSLVPVGSRPDGIEINSSFNTVRNNDFAFIDFGVILGGPQYPGNIVKTNSIQRNRIGSSGRMTGDGVFLYDGAQENFIGPLNTITNLDGVGVELIHVSNKLNVIFDNDILVEFAGIAIGGGAAANAVGGPFGGNRVQSDTGLVLGFRPGNAAHNTWVEGNQFKEFAGTQAETDFGAIIQGGSTGNFLGSNAFLGNTVGVYLGDSVAGGTGRNAVNGNRFGATFGGCEWASNQYALYFRYSNYNFAQNNGATNPYYYQFQSRGNAISVSQICTSASPGSSTLRSNPADIAVPTVTKEFGTRLPG